MKNALLVFVGVLGTSAMSLVLTHVLGHASCQVMVVLSFFVAWGLVSVWCASIPDVSQNAWNIFGTLFFLSYAAFSFAVATGIVCSAVTGSYPPSLFDQRVLYPAVTVMLIAFAAMRFVRSLAVRIAP